MPRCGDGIYLMRRTWRLDVIHQGERHVVRPGRNISRTASRGE